MHTELQTIRDIASRARRDIAPLATGLTGKGATAVTTLMTFLRNGEVQIDAALRELEATGPKRHRLDRGEFRLLFTFDERTAESAFEGAAKAALASGTETAEQRVYLTMRADFNDAGHINLDDPAVHAALDFYVAFGLLTPERRDYVLTGYRPGEMPEPEEPEGEPEE